MTAAHDAGSVSALSQLPAFDLGHAMVVRNGQVPGAAPDGFASFQKALKHTDVFYFDMDNTLVDTRPRHLEAMKQLLAQGTNLTPADQRALQNASLEQTRYSPEQTADVLGLSPEATRQYLKLWKEVFWDPNLAASIDRKMDHVIALAKQAHDAGKTVRILSGRIKDFWGDAPWQHLKTAGLDFLRPEDVLLKARGENVLEFKSRVVMAEAAAGRRVALVTDAPDEIAHAQRAAEKAGPTVGARVDCIQVEFPYLPGDVPVSPDTPLVSFGDMSRPSLKPKSVRVIVGNDGKSGEVTSGRTAASRQMASNIGRGIERILGNTLVLDSPRQLPGASSSLAANRPVRIAIGGFFRPPEGSGHHEVVRQLLDGVVDALGSKHVALLTSATTANETLERLVTELSVKKKVPTLYFTSSAYVGAADPSELPEALRSHYQKSTKVVMPETDLYGWGEMATSTALINTGGQGAALSDFVKAVKLGNPVSLVVNRDLGPVELDPATQLPSIAPGYLVAMLAAREKIVSDGQRLGHSREQIEAAVREPGRYPYPFMPGRDFDPEFLVRYGTELSRRVVSVEVGRGDDLAPAVTKIVRHLRLHLGLDT